MNLSVRWLGRIDYAAALALQDRLVEDCLAGRETLLLLEHEPVYTIGRTRNQSSLGDPAHLPHPVFETNRGGQATWHGPGQLVAYPILRLDQRGRDLHRYLRFLEDVVIATCRIYNVPTDSRAGLTGVWAGPRKIASLGVGVRRWVSMHGLALNVTNEALGAFEHITPCGIVGVEMTSLEKETGRVLGIREVADTLSSAFRDEAARWILPQP